MLAEPGERTLEPRQLSYQLVAEDEGLLVGVIDVLVRPWRRVEGRGHVILGVRASHHRRGIGRALLNAAIAEARRRSMHRLELTTMAHNDAAIALYRSCGFEHEGLRRASLVIDGRPIDEIYMGLLL
ncbi:GNAT family N-acetyltransferase [Actinomadura harenae]|nr:GNAT family N-acetyltransferase [Actinomadura harenae]